MAHHRHTSRILTSKPLVDFDPRNPEHVDAAMHLLLNNKQHETIRFKVEWPFISVQQHVLHRMAVYHAEVLTGRSYDADGMFAGPGVSLVANNVVHFRPTYAGAAHA